MREPFTQVELNQKLVGAAKLAIAVFDSSNGFRFEGDDRSMAEIMAKFVHLANLRFGSDTIKELVGICDQRHERYLQGLCVLCGKPCEEEKRTCKECDARFVEEHFPNRTGIDLEPGITAYPRGQLQ